MFSISIHIGYCFLGAIAFEQLEKEYELQVEIQNKSCLLLNLKITVDVMISEF